MTYNVFSGTLNPTQCVSVGIKSRLEHNFIWVNLRSKDFIKANAIRSVILKVCKLIVVLLWRAQWVHAVKYWFAVTVCNLQQLECIACFDTQVNEYCYLYLLLANPTYVLHFRERFEIWTNDSSPSLEQLEIGVWDLMCHLPIPTT